MAFGGFSSVRLDNPGLRAQTRVAGKLSWQLRGGRITEMLRGLLTGLLTGQRAKKALPKVYPRLIPEP
jgi:hypothetical protein